ncbi:MAG: aminotransferase class I/II-fold pyridoxal phosphate-dependent enzyme [Candidatus Binatus sp.]|uniref:aminotransferase class I/II-fold pyridoxal phosphate-dependent enzyme n=1 Tax=Candidatus Binatus sp. TaxID=2811406 RepID=UPI002716CC6C|nr:aminotransferase class I/II-fold pyridoxal phosphate-dependent enzyme [Candidatus Binatus sp.]MDO8432354.1 aminotransferase class I/II-fold pyridoxal phosphate-dependent enzyme [Candidatus Binatus sp.]
MNVTVHYQIRGDTSNQIAASIEDAIRTGRLGAGDRLPTVRALALRLKVSPTTVAAAYNSLRVRGLVHGAGRRGTVVNRRPALATSIRSALSKPRKGLRNLADGGPDPAMLPPLKPFLARLDGSPGQYGDDENRPALVKLATRQFKSDGIAVGELAIVSGALSGIERVMQAYLSPGDIVAVEDPSYTGVLDLIAAMGLIAEPMALDDSGPLPDEMNRALRRGAKACIVTPRAQNPTGAALDKKRATELRPVLARYPQVVLIEDDHAGPAAGAPAITLSRGVVRWALIRSVSKSLAPDLRVGVMAGDEQTIARVHGRQSLGPRWVSHILQDLVALVWADPATPHLLKTAALTYSRRRAALIDSLAEHGIEARGRSGLNVWIPVAEESAVVQAMAEKGWAIRAGESYRIKSGPAVRITVATLTPDESKRLANDLAAAIRPRSRVQTA